jgi:hypothetical protein
LTATGEYAGRVIPTKPSATTYREENTGSARDQGDVNPSGLPRLQGISGQNRRTAQAGTINTTDLVPPEPGTLTAGAVAILSNDRTIVPAGTTITISPVHEVLSTGIAGAAVNLAETSESVLLYLILSGQACLNKEL